MTIKSLLGICLLLLNIEVYADDVTLPPETETITKTSQESPPVSETTVTPPPPSSPKKNKEEGDKFFQNNKNKPGVVTLVDGLQYKIIKPGKGPKPTAKDLITVEYTGRFIDGTVFDSSKQHDGPVVFSLDEVIPGWAEALKNMPVGSTWELYVPPQLAYGNDDAPVAIGPYKTLIFTIHVLDLKKM